MAQPLRIKTDTDERIYNTEAYFLASPIIWTPSQTLIPIDGSNAGKRKVGNNADTYADLDFENSGTGGGASNTDELTNNSSVSGATASDALNTLLGADQSLDSEKQDKLLFILTINDDNHTLDGTEYFIRATGTDPTWVTDTGNLDPGYPLELANDSTNDMTFVPDSGSNIVLSPGGRASLRHRSGGAWISMFSGVDTALAAKADASNVPTVYECVAAGTTVAYALNQFATAFTITNPTTGIYAITADTGGPFTANKVFVSIEAMESVMPGTGVHATWFPNSTSIIEFGFTDKNGSPVDPESYSLCIRVYP